ncbi:CoA transferase [Pseudidiomarina sediminum]|uniref:CoA transferase n=1 Tax=Pseudidiomarina sediminum TaxID=431675 RepID=A0A432Z3P6_9GAMM|nr:CoA transferase [Pseudidiomarina sediminum]RUO72506.1 CoA transferase [Pseudidiomarina sediminum]
MHKLLAGIRVLDFGRYIAGPFCATLLADLGADVIRIEKPSGGEDRYTVPVTSQGEGAYYLQLGRNKRGITLNPTSTEGREVVRKLVASADVVVANLPTPALKKLGLDYESLRAIKADIILTTGSAFGATGPYAARGGFDTVAQAMSGAMYLSGDNNQPAKSFAPYCDFGTASLSAFGTLAALMHRQQTGEGQVVEGSLLSTALTFNNAALMEQALIGINRQGSGTQGQYNAPTDTFKTRDGYITVQVVGAGIFKRWANLMGEREWLDNPRFDTDQKRGDHANEINQRMARWCRERDTQQALDDLANAGIPSGEMLKPDAVLTHEHIQQARMFQWLTYPDMTAEAPIAEHPIRYSRTSVPPFRRAPSLGEHTDEVLEEIGYNAEQIRQLRRSGII